MLLLLLNRRKCNVKTPERWGPKTALVRSSMMSEGRAGDWWRHSSADLYYSYNLSEILSCRLWRSLEEAAARLDYFKGILSQDVLHHVWNIKYGIVLFKT